MEPRLAITIAAVKAVEYKDRKPNAESEEIISSIIKAMGAHGEAEIAAVAAATKAIKYKDENPRAKDKEIIQKVVSEADEIMDIVENKDNQI